MWGYKDPPTISLKSSGCVSRVVFALAMRQRRTGRTGQALALLARSSVPRHARTHGLTHRHHRNHRRHHNTNTNRSINPTSFDQGWSKLNQCPPTNVDIANQAVTTAVDVSFCWPYCLLACDPRFPLTYTPPAAPPALPQLSPVHTTRIQYSRASPRCPSPGTPCRARLRTCRTASCSCPASAPARGRSSKASNSNSNSRS